MCVLPFVSNQMDSTASIAVTVQPIPSKLRKRLSLFIPYSLFSFRVKNEKAQPVFEILYTTDNSKHKRYNMSIQIDKEIQLPNAAGRSILDLALEHGIPMANLCKGKARCSTCRVVLLKGEAPPRNEKEQALADKLGLSEHVRLSCQLEATNDMILRRVIHDELDRKLLGQSNTAEERSLAILFSDIRSFTPFSERHLPYDIVHILNRYFYHMGNAIHNNHGQIDKYMGDGIMAIFGLKSDEHPAQSALRSAREMLASLEEFNTYLKASFDEEFSVGIGIHYGPVVVGNLGHPNHANFTAIGDTVNAAARIESATKGRAPILISKDMADALGETTWPSFTV